MDTPFFQNKEVNLTFVFLKEFWEWAKMTPEEYAKNGMDYQNGEGEFYFPGFSQLFNYVKANAARHDLSDEEKDDILTILALDNEAENVLDYLASHLNPKQIEKIVKTGIHHMQPQARWQIAELACRLKPEGYVNYLQELSNDPDAYVRKRAGNCLQSLGVV